MKTPAKTVAEYLALLSTERRAEIEAIRAVILANLDGEFEEGILYGMIGYYVPHRVFPAGYHADPKQPLPFAALGSMKSYISLHLMPLYSGEGGEENEHARWFGKAWLAAGKKLDMGKACIRIKRLEDVPLNVVGQAIRRITTKQWISMYQAMRAATKPVARTKTRKKN